MIRNIKIHTPIQDDGYYSGYVKIFYWNPKTKKKWNVVINDNEALENKVEVE